MAKKIKLDFSKVEERSGWNTKGIPEGVHKMRVADVQETEAGDGTPMLVYSLVPTDPRYKTRNFPFYCKLQQNQLWKLRDLIVATGGTVPKKLGLVDPNGPVGKFVAVEVEDEVGQYAGRSSVNGTYDLTILEDDGDDSPSDDEDEEYEGDDEADEADDEEYEEEEGEDDEEEEAEDLSELTLPELRKRAKASGIDTAGLKKDQLIEAIEEAEAEEDDEDEDLDDEDLEDDDLDEDELEDDEDEDEEEEPEPAPKARKAPARKAPAKAAPAKRVVRRR